MTPEETARQLIGDLVLFDELTGDEFNQVRTMLLLAKPISLSANGYATSALFRIAGVKYEMITWRNNQVHIYRFKGN